MLIKLDILLISLAIYSPFLLERLTLNNSIKRRMGNEQSHENDPPTQEQLLCPSFTITPNPNEISDTSDPLRCYLHNRNISQVKVKTLADIQRSNQKIVMANRQQVLAGVQPNSNKTMQNSLEFSTQDQPVLSQTLLLQSKQNFSPVVGTDIRDIDSKNASQHRKDQKKSNFKAVSISQQSFLKIHQQSPQGYYEFKEMIGQGSYGKVYRAICRKNGEERAIKVLKTKFMRQQKKKQFLAEMTLLSKLNHPSIITLYDLFQHQKMYYVVMEYCRGGSVIELISKIANKSQRIIANIMKQLFRALAYMHSLNIIHRDIKLQNIVFLKETVEFQEEYIPIKIIDFGTAVHSPIKISQGYPISGTLSYIAPEVLRGTLTEKSDIWSSGVLMFILLTGVPPFRGRNQAQTKDNIKSKILNYSEPPLSSLSDEAKDLLQKMLNKNAIKRISAIEALHHPWLAKSDSASISSTNLQNLQNYYRGNNLVSVIESFLSLRKITQEERQKLADTFTSIDKDGNGLIEREQLVQILKTKVESFKNMDEVQADNLINSIDRNNSGQIDFNQFIIAMYDKEKLYIKESLNEAFEYFDKDKTGFIEIEELKNILNGGDAAQVEYFINLLDKDNDKRISREEFITYLINY